MSSHPAAHEGARAAARFASPSARNRDPQVGMDSSNYRLQNWLALTGAHGRLSAEGSEPSSARLHPL